jgi:hypothetical protein
MYSFTMSLQNDLLIESCVAQCTSIGFFTSMDQKMTF